MTKKSGFVLICAFACLWTAWTGSADGDTSSKFLSSCPFQVGDSIEKVKHFYSITHEPKRLNRVTASSSAYEYRFPEFGVSIFFDVNSRVNILRFDQPFTGKIGGIAIGDSKDMVRRVRGEPAREFRGLPDKEVLVQQKLRRQQILAALPDLVPKQDVLNTINELSRLDKTTIDSLYMTAWIYQSDRLLRYEFGSVTNQVQTILSGSCNIR